jgi:hypothetical protein
MGAGNHGDSNTNIQTPNSNSNIGGDPNYKRTVISNARMRQLTSNK